MDHLRAQLLCLFQRIPVSMFTTTNMYIYVDPSLEGLLSMK